MHSSDYQTSGLGAAGLDLSPEQDISSHMFGSSIDRTASHDSFGAILAQAVQEAEQERLQQQQQQQEVAAAAAGHRQQPQPLTASDVPQQHQLAFEASGDGQAASDAALHADDEVQAPAPPLHVCMVDGCGADLTGMKPYFRRSKVCPSHQSMPVVLLNGVESRFCQQCTRCHVVEEFDGTKRSCRSQLLHHNKSRKHRRRCTPGSFYTSKRARPNNSSSLARMKKAAAPRAPVAAKQPAAHGAAAALAAAAAQGGPCGLSSAAAAAAAAAMPLGTHGDIWASTMLLPQQQQQQQQQQQEASFAAAYQHCSSSSLASGYYAQLPHDAAAEAAQAQQKAVDDAAAERECDELLEQLLRQQQQQQQVAAAAAADGSTVHTAMIAQQSQQQPQQQQQQQQQAQAQQEAPFGSSSALAGFCPQPGGLAQSHRVLSTGVVTKLEDEAASSSCCSSRGSPQSATALGGRVITTGQYQQQAAAQQQQYGQAQASAPPAQQPPVISMAASLAIGSVRPGYVSVLIPTGELDYAGWQALLGQQAQVQQQVQAQAQLQQHASAPAVLLDAIGSYDSCAELWGSQAGGAMPGAPGQALQGSASLSAPLGRQQQQKVSSHARVTHQDPRSGGAQRAQQSKARPGQQAQRRTPHSSSKVIAAAAPGGAKPWQLQELHALAHWQQAQQQTGAAGSTLAAGGFLSPALQAAGGAVAGLGGTRTTFGQARPVEAMAQFAPQSAWVAPGSGSVAAALAGMGAGAALAAAGAAPYTPPPPGGLGDEAALAAASAALLEEPEDTCGWLLDVCTASDQDGGQGGLMGGDSLCDLFGGQYGQHKQHAGTGAASGSC